MIIINVFIKYFKISAVTSKIVSIENETLFEVINIWLLIWNEWNKILISGSKKIFSIYTIMILVIKSVRK